MPSACDADAEPVPPLSRFDDELIRLGAELEAVRRNGGSALHDSMLRKICAEIEDHVAQGLAGLFVKARAADILAQQEEQDASLSLRLSVMQDLAALEARLGACPIERLVWEASALIEASQALEKQTRDTIEEEKQLSERLKTLEAAGLSAPARSALGAMFQVYAVSDLVDDIEDVGASQVIFRKLRRGLCSILSVLETIAGQRVETCRAYCLAPDPFACREEAA